MQREASSAHAWRTLRTACCLCLVLPVSALMTPTAAARRPSRSTTSTMIDLQDAALISGITEHSGMETFRARLAEFSAPEETAPQLPTQKGLTDEERHHVHAVYDRLLQASDLMDESGRVELSAADVATALSDMHLAHTQGPPHDALQAPSVFLPAELYADCAVDVTELVRETLPRVLEAHPIFAYMAEETLGNDEFWRSVYFGTASEPVNSPSRLSFAALCRRLVASVYVFELLIAMDHQGHRQLAAWYEAALVAARQREQIAPEARGGRTPRDALMGFFLALKGESVLASINAFEMMRRLGVGDDADAAPAVSALSRVLNDIMSLNIFEAVLSNLSFAFWPDNARAGMALLWHPQGAFSADGTQDLDAEWLRLYLGWSVSAGLDPKLWAAHVHPLMSSPTGHRIDARLRRRQLRLAVALLQRYDGLHDARHAVDRARRTWRVSVQPRAHPLLGGARHATHAPCQRPASSRAR